MGMKIINTDTLIDIVTFLSAFVLIWGIETVRIVPLNLSLYTWMLIGPVYPFPVSSGPGAGLLHLAALGFFYAALISVVVVFAVRKIRRTYR